MSKQKQGQKRRQKKISPAEIVFFPAVLIEKAIEAIAAEIVLRYIT